MQLAKFLNKLIKKGGFTLIDAFENEHKIGQKEFSEKIILKITDKTLHYKLLIYPDLYFGEAYTDGTIYFKRGNLTSFLNIALENIGRSETNKFSELLNRFRGSLRYLTNFNFIKKSKNECCSSL
jgi:hypothetical protein